MQACNLVPAPQSLYLRDGKLSMSAIREICLPDNGDPRVVRAAAAWQQQQHPQPALLSVGSSDGPHRLSITTGSADSEGYRLTIAADRIELAGESPAGVFYGLQTLRQLQKVNGDTLPCCVIDDRPDFPLRGFYHDVTRGRVPTLETLKVLADRLAAGKYNMLQLYVEHTFAFPEYDGINTPDGRLTADDILELDAYCHDRFIELVPSLSSFAHLYELLQSDRYRPLCELENYKPDQHRWIERMRRHTIDPSNPDSRRLIKRLIDQFLPLFRSRRFNLCCDETFDLGKGRNRGRDTGALYFDYVSELIRHVQLHGRQPMLWGDIVLHYPERLSSLPEGITLLNWDYSPTPNEEAVAFFERHRLPQIVCPGTDSWNRFVENPSVSAPNIGRMAAYGLAHGAIGLMVTNWGDYGHIAPPGCALYGLAAGAQKGWHTAAPLDGSFDRAVSLQFYDDASGRTPGLIRDLAACEDSARWDRLVRWASDREAALACTPDTDTHAARAEELEKELAAVQADGGDPAVYEELRLAAEAIGLMNRLYPVLAGQAPSDDSAALRSALADWTERYAACWRRGSRESDLPILLDFLQLLQSQIR